MKTHSPKILDETAQRQEFTPADARLAVTLYGQQDRNLRQLERLAGGWPER